MGIFNKNKNGRNPASFFLNNISILTYLVGMIVSVIFGAVEFAINGFEWRDPAAWIVLLINYIIILFVLFVMCPFFVRKLKSSEESQKTIADTNNLIETIKERKLSEIYEEYTKEQMIKEERDFFIEILKHNGNLDPIYLDCDFSFIKEQYKKELIDKSQYKLIRKIRNGKIKFSKLDGTEIHFIDTDKIQANKKYKNARTQITAQQVLFQLVFCLIINVAMNIIILSNLKADMTLIVVNTFLTLFRYVSATWFALKTANLINNEWIRFSKEVVFFTQLFIEKIDNKTYVPKVNETVFEQLQKYKEEHERQQLKENVSEDERHQDQDDDEVIELTENELQLIQQLRDRKAIDEISKKN